ncbi:MAG: SDR family oxidoreductase [Rhodobacteraceae bacterium]|nr:SDR family oxidoreductase [Paracoccaceae bacterium]
MRPSKPAVRSAEQLLLPNNVDLTRQKEFAMTSMFRRRFLAVAACFAFAAHCANVDIMSKARAQEGPSTPPELPSMAGQTVLVLGGTGRTGAQVVELLLAQGVKVRSTSRNAAKAKAAQPNAEWVDVDFRQIESVKGLTKGVDKVVFATGANSFREPDNTPSLVEFEAPAAIIDEAKANGVKQIVLITSVSTTAADPAATKGFPGVMRYKLDLENHLKASGVPYTIVRPVGLVNDPRGKDAIALLPGDVQVPAMISRGDVALVIVDALANPDAIGKSFTAFNVIHPDKTGWKSQFAHLPADK